MSVGCFLIIYHQYLVHKNAVSSTTHSGFENIHNQCSRESYMRLNNTALHGTGTSLILAVHSNRYVKFTKYIRQFNLINIEFKLYHQRSFQTIARRPRHGFSRQSFSTIQ